MALYSASELRARPTPAPAARTFNRGETAALLDRLYAENRRPPVSRPVLVGSARIGEFVLLALSGLAAGYVTGRPGALTMALSLAGAGAATSAFQALRSYSVQALRFPARHLVRLAGAWGALAILSLFVCETCAPLLELWLLAWFWIGLAALVVCRGSLAVLVKTLARAGRLERRAVVVGGGTDFSRELLRDLVVADSAEVRLLGVFDDRNDGRSPSDLEGVPKLGAVDDLIDFARRARVDLVIFALPIAAEARILEMLRKLWILPVDVRLAAHANRLRLRPRSYSYVGEAAMLDVFDRPLADWDLVVKAALDRLLGALALIALSPLMLAAAIAIKLESRGPILFKQIRYGFNNELIEIYKFRSMRAEQNDPLASKLVTRNDPRVTKVGRFLRRTSIDELPQLFNVVFRGDLSLVGPRPHAIHAKAEERQYDEVVDGYFARHRVKPGITGWAQINGWRGETDTAEKIQKRVDHDLHYIENWSIFLDLYILAVTPYALVTGRNAY